ncbi:hypothetical protein [Thermoactinospora rubra]|uniref:hypothetical protein n=1 Tax=Thermoactinospora rubra TaxID=1088767 RepID=UPI000A11E0A4|nr:hypothetical protein [Thermoactinospora rubra]
MSSWTSSWSWRTWVGRRITVSAVSSGAAELTVYDDDEKPMTIASALIAPENAQALADAVRRACRG